MGLFGCGAIGAAVAYRCQAFGMTVHAHDPFLPIDQARPGVTTCSWDDLLRVSDVLSLHAPLTEETRGIVNANALARMKPTALLINSSRGGLVNEAALLDALTQGQLAFAGPRRVRPRAATSE